MHEGHCLTLDGPSDILEPVLLPVVMEGLDEDGGVLRREVEILG